MQIAAAIERGEVLGRLAQGRAKGDGVMRQPLAVSVGVLVPGLDHEREAAQDSFGRVQVVGVLLESNERRDPGLQFLGIERLSDEVVGAGLQAADLVLAGVEPGDERDRNQPRLWRLLQIGADLEAVDAGHLDIQQHQVDVPMAERRHRFVPRRDRHDLIPELFQQPLEQCAVDVLVVADENRSQG